MGTIRLTGKGKALILILILALAGLAIKFTGGFKLPSFSKEVIPTMGKAFTPADPITISLDQWVGWKPCLDANGGLETQSGSIYDKLGLKLKFVVIDDATQSSNALIKGDLQGAGYTINRYSFLYPKFNDAKVPVVMPYITNYSTGGDGIIAKAGINSIEGLVGKRIAVPKYSEAQTLTMWLLGQSNLTADQKKQVAKDIVYFNDPGECAKAFFAGKVDAAATWQPYLSQAAGDGSSKVLFSTKDAHNIILDGMVFRKDFYDSNKETVAKIIEGALQAKTMYATDTKAIKSFPLFATETDDNIKAMTADASLASYADNKKLFGGTAQLLFSDMSSVWLQLGEKANPEAKVVAFDTSALDLLSGKFSDVAEAKPAITTAQKDKASQGTSLLTKTCTIEFNSNAASFKDPNAAAQILDDFANAAKIMDGTVVQVEGNIADLGSSGTASVGGQQLSYLRAKAVADYMARMQGIDPQRFVIIGNGVSKQVAPNDTEDNQRKNRRTDIFFKTVE